MNIYIKKINFESKFLFRTFLFLFFAFTFYLIYNFSKFILIQTIDIVQSKGIILINVSPLETLSVIIYLNLLLILLISIILTYFYFFMNYKDALTPKEITYYKYFGLSLFLGIAGSILSYFLSIHYFLPYFFSYNIQINIINNYVSIEKLFNFILSNIIIFFIIFQIPTILRTLIGLNFISKEKLKTYRSYYFFLFLVFASVITPIDILSTIIVTSIGQILYEVSIL